MHMYSHSCAIITFQCERKSLVLDLVLVSDLECLALKLQHSKHMKVAPQSDLLLLYTLCLYSQFSHATCFTRSPMIVEFEKKPYILHYGQEHTVTTSNLSFASIAEIIKS